MKRNQITNLLAAYIKAYTHIQAILNWTCSSVSYSTTNILAPVNALADHIVLYLVEMSAGHRTVNNNNGKDISLVK